MLTVKTFDIEGPKLVQPKVFKDHRGYFVETYNKARFEEFGLPTNWVQDNESFSGKDTLRGLHFQVKRPQGKLVRAVVGEIFDVAVDIRPNSPTYGQWVAEILSAENKAQLWVPEGFAHGFQVLSETAIVAYKCTDIYMPEYDRGLMWNDPDLAVAWPNGNTPILSEKDTRHPNLKALIQE